MIRSRLLKSRWFLLMPLLAVLVVTAACGADPTPERVVVEKEVPIEVIKEVPVTVEVFKEVIKEVAKEVIQEVPVTVEVPKEVVREIVVTKEVIKEVPKEVIKEVEVTKEVIKEVEKEVRVTVVVTPTPTAVPAPTPVPDLGVLKAGESGAKYGGVLKWGGLAASALYDMHQSGTISNMGPQAPMYDLLVQNDPINWNRIIPDLAETWKISSDGLTYTFTLRDGVKFHDGASLTAADVAASFSQIIFPPEGVLSPRRTMFDGVEKVADTDDSTVVFSLREPRSFLLNGVAMGMNTITSKKALEENDYNLRKLPNYPGTGPFKFLDHEFGVGWTLVKNENYWNPDLPYLDGIEFFHVGIGPAVGAACLANTVDFCQFIDIGTEERAGSKPGLLTARVFLTAPQGFFLNQKTKPFDDARVRRAIDLVLDKPAMRDAVRDLFNIPAGGWLMATDPFFDEYWKTAKDQPHWRSPTDEDFAEARRLMAEAGYADGAKGFDFIVNPIPWEVKLTPVIQDVLKRELKIETNIRPVGFAAWFGELAAGTFDMSIGAYAGSIPHVADYWATGFKTGGGWNYVSYSNPKFDAIHDEILRETDPVKLKAIIDRGIEILDEDQPWTIFGNLFLIHGWWEYLKGHQTARKKIYFWEGGKKDIWWLDK